MGLTASSARLDKLALQIVNLNVRAVIDLQFAIIIFYSHKYPVDGVALWVLNPWSTLKHTEAQLAVNRMAAGVMDLFFFFFFFSYVQYRNYSIVNNDKYMQQMN